MKPDSSFSWDRYYEAPVIGIIRNMPLSTIHQISKIYLEVGFTNLEVTMNTPGAENVITALRNEFPELNVGAGTVCNTAQLNQAIEAGSQFIVTPIMDQEVIRTSVAQDIPIFPGAYSPTEIYKSWELGASAVKIFPATLLGVQFIKDILAPLDEIKLLPTGGVSVENIKSYFEAGATGVGMGSSLFNKKMIEQGDLNALGVHFKVIKAEIKEFTRHRNG